MNIELKIIGNKVCEVYNNGVCVAWFAIVTTDKTAIFATWLASRLHSVFENVASYTMALDTLEDITQKQKDFTHIFLRLD